MISHWFWTVVVVLVLVWYIVVTLIVSVRGGKDIREMIREWGKDD